MIKTALKHWIYELCINQIFNAINSNFTTVPKKLQLKIGETYSEIWYRTSRNTKLILQNATLSQLKINNTMALFRFPDPNELHDGIQIHSLTLVITNNIFKIVK